MLDYWHRAHEITNMTDRRAGVSTKVLYQRKFGDANTYFGNTTVLMVVLATVINLSDCELMLFSGDDSLLIGCAIDSDLCSGLFNLETKFQKQVPVFLL